jgi:hypothetical protein
MYTISSFGIQHFVPKSCDYEISRGNLQPFFGCFWIRERFFAKMGILQTVSEDKALLAATVCFGVVGALFTAIKAFSFIKMILDVLVVPGISVSECHYRDVNRK